FSVNTLLLARSLLAALPILGNDLVPVFQLDPEHRVREGLGNGAFKFYDVVFRHASCVCCRAAGADHENSGSLCHAGVMLAKMRLDRKSTSMNSSHVKISYAV